MKAETWAVGLVRRLLDWIRARPPVSRCGFALARRGSGVGGLAPQTACAELIPESFHSGWLPLLWVAGLGVMGVGLARAARSRGPLAATDAGGTVWRVLALGASLLIVPLAFLAYRPVLREYSPTQLLSYAGEAVADSRASSGLALFASPVRHDPGKLAVTRPEFYPAGSYQLAAWLRAGPAQGSAGGPMASLQVIGSQRPLVASTSI